MRKLWNKVFKWKTICRTDDYNLLCLLGIHEWVEGSTQSKILKYGIRRCEFCNKIQELKLLKTK